MASNRHRDLHELLNRRPAASAACIQLTMQPGDIGGNDMAERAKAQYPRRVGSITATGGNINRIFNGVLHFNDTVYICGPEHHVYAEDNVDTDRVKIVGTVE